ncbi:hypothetical protein H312_03008 [Anncaliia algerae PRA339]|uniref:UBC core domain-containing protein n=1 Tax=Anncaliia algerae PRA339 TaxID=1288291 RepID=A0A059EY28_9MICR|nr:hypothetical protein H312_03008 [Anncaliia algerae PRA339]
MPSIHSRLKSEFVKLFNAKFKVKIRNESENELEVTIDGPTDTPYKDGKYIIFIRLTPDYPYRSPSVGFSTKIFHPNIDEKSGSVCLDVLNQYWSPLYDCKIICESFIPLLLRYPNPSDPLNPEAAALLMKSCDSFNEAVIKHVRANALVSRKFVGRKTISDIDSDSLEL